MAGFDFDRPYIDESDMETFTANIAEVGRKFGKKVKATDLSNKEYKFRYQKLAKERNMKAPPSSNRMFMGHLVVRNLGKKNQYETWMPTDVFEELYGVLDKALEAQRNYVKYGSNK